MRHHTCSSRKKGIPIIPIGLVNLTNGKNSVFDTIWSGWEENPQDINLLIVDNGTYRVIYAGGIDIDVDDTMKLCHDQRNHRIGGTWKVIATVPHTKEGFIQLKNLTKRTSLSFACFTNNNHYMDENTFKDQCNRTIRIVERCVSLRELKAPKEILLKEVEIARETLETLHADLQSEMLESN